MWRDKIAVGIYGDEEMTVSELQELMNENEKFLLGEIQKMKKEQITKDEIPYSEWQSLGNKLEDLLEKKELERRDMPNIHDCKCEDKSTHYHLTVCCKGMKNEDGTLNKSDFYKEIEQAINRHSKENESNTPDWVLAEYLLRCLSTFNACVDMRERYYGRERK